MTDESDHEGYYRAGTPLIREVFALLGIKSARRKRREQKREE